MGKKYNNIIPLQAGFSITEPIPADDRYMVETRNDVTTAIVVPIGFEVSIEDELNDDNTFKKVQYIGGNVSNLNNWIEVGLLDKNRITALENTTSALSSGIGYAIPQSGNTPSNEPAPTLNGIYRAEAGTYTNWSGIVVPNTNGFIYDIQVSNVETTPVYTLQSTDLNITLDNEISVDSDNPVKNKSIYNSLKYKANLIIGKNLFDKNSTVVGFISSTTGNISSSNTDYATSDFIDLEGFDINDFIANNDIRFSCFFAEDKVTVVAGGWTSNTKTFTKPSTAKYGRFSIALPLVDINTFQLENGNVSTNYEDYGIKLNEDDVRDNSISGKKVKTNSIPNDRLKYNSITANKLDIIERSKNIFDNTDPDIVRGGFISSLGSVGSNSNYSVTGFMLIENLKTYKNSHRPNSPSTYYAYYDKDKVFISASPSPTENLAAPENAIYRRDTLQLNDTDDITLLEIQIEEGSTSTTYVPFSEIIKNKHLPDTIGTDGEDGLSAYEIWLNNGNTGTEQDFLNSLKGADGDGANIVTGLYDNNLLRNPDNLWDKNDPDYLVDFFLVGENPTSSSTYDTSGFIEKTKEGTVFISQYTWATTGRFVTFYDENKVLLTDETLQNVSSFNYPTGAKYFRVSIQKALVDVVFIEIGFTRSKMFSVANNDLIPSLKYVGTIEAFLPPKIYVGLGRTIEIYNNQVALCVNENDFSFKWDAFTNSKSIGVTYKNKFVIDTSSEEASLVDSYTLVLTVFDKYFRLVTQVQSTLEVVDMTIDIPTPLKVLGAGDSLLNKPYLHESRDLLTAKFGKVVLDWIGTRDYLHGTAQDKLDIKHEGFSGWRAEQFTASAGIYQNRNLKLMVSGITVTPAPKKIYAFTLEDATTHNYEVEDVFNENNELFTGSNGTLTYITFNAIGTVPDDPSGRTTGGTITGTNAGEAGDSTIAFSSYTDIGGNPFWNTETDAVDFANYLSQNSLPTPQAMMTMLGTNHKTDFQQTIDFINLVQSQLSNIPVFVIIPQYDGRYITDLGLRKRWFEHCKGLVNGLKNNPNIYFIPIAYCHDSKHNYFNSSININPHNSFITEKIYTASDFVHPQNWGYSQFGDVIFSAFLAEYINL